MRLYAVARKWVLRSIMWTIRIRKYKSMLTTSLPWRGSGKQGMVKKVTVKRLHVGLVELEGMKSLLWRGRDMQRKVTGTS